MGLTGLLDIELAVPEPVAVAAFWRRRGLIEGADGSLRTPEGASVLRLREATYRHVAEVRLACAAESDLTAIAARLDRLGVAAEVVGGRLRCTDPLGDHRVVVSVAEPVHLRPAEPATANRPGDRRRLDRRSPACLGQVPTAPRRLGHVVLGTTDVAASRAFYEQGLGFRVSDGVAGGLGWFLRCSPDHHNLLLMPAPVPCLNHYALEVEDVDAIGLLGHRVLAEHPDVAVTGVGRHVVGANLYWYLRDPAGGMFELYSDMDQITDDAGWAADHRRDDWDPFTVSAWASAEPSPDFFLPADIDDIATARQAVGR